MARRPSSPLLLHCNIRSLVFRFVSGDRLVPRQTSRPRHRLDQRHRACDRPRPRQGRRGRDDQRHGRPRRYREGARRASRPNFGVKAFYNGADMTKPAEIEAMIAEAIGKMGSLDILVNNAGIQFVSPIENFPAGEMGRDHRDQPLRGVPRDPRGGAGHEGAEMGPHRQHRLRPFAGRLAVQVGLCRRQARPRRPHQNRRAWNWRPLASPAIAFRPAMSGRRWSRNRFPIR